LLRVDVDGPQRLLAGQQQRAAEDCRGVCARPGKPTGTATSCTSTLASGSENQQHKPDCENPRTAR
jgi:hypothetical protein